MKMGKLIVLEGADTSGKTTTINKIKTVLPIIYATKRFDFTREPGNLLSPNNNESERIRNILLTDTSLTARKQAELFAKARFLHTKDIVKKLKQGVNVIVDRYIISSLIYQGIEIGNDEVLKLNNESLKLLKDENIEIHNIVLQISKDTYDKRISNKEKDAMEMFDDETINKRINMLNDSFELSNLKIGKIYKVNANKTAEDTCMKTLNYIYEILN